METPPLHLRVDTAALDSALKDGAGNITTNDYRGVRVFSSFEKINFHNSTWIIVAEIDEDEVITSQYIQNCDEYAQQLFSKPVYGAASKYVLEVSEDDLRVDINEFAKALPKQSLRTIGISTCTGILITKENQFSYLGHIFPLDKSYISPLDRWLVKLGFALRGQSAIQTKNDLLGEMTNQLFHHDIYPSEIRDLKVLLVAVHDQSFATIIDRLIEKGFFLSQINVLYVPNAHYANIVASAGGGKTIVSFEGDGAASVFSGETQQQINLGQMVKGIVGL